MCNQKSEKHFTDKENMEKFNDCFQPIMNENVYILKSNNVN